MLFSGCWGSYGSGFLGAGLLRVLGFRVGSCFFGSGFAGGLEVLRWRTCRVVGVR